MNMNKILAAGLIAAVASTASFAQCGNGGFYVGANAGIAFTKMKVNATDEGYRTSKKKTKFLADLVFGYDHRINDVMLGADLTVGMQFGKTKVNVGEAESEDNINLKNTWNIALMPRVGYLVMPQLELYATAGVKIAHWKLTYTPNGEDAKSAKKIKFLPVVGGGLRYEITPDIYAKLEYNFEFKKGVKLPKFDDEGTLKVSSVKPQAHIIKLGVGFRF